MIRKIKAFILALFGRPPSHSHTFSGETPAKPARSRDKTKEAETNRYYYLGDVLDNLDDYYKSIHRVARHDPHGFALLAQVGGVLAPEDSTYAVGEKFKGVVPPWWGDGPSFLCVYWPFEASDETLGLKLGYLVKETPPDGVANIDGTTYRVVIWYLDDKTDLVAPIEFFLAVRDGKITPRRRARTEYQSLPRRNHRQKERGVVPHRKWLYGTERLTRVEEGHDTAKEMCVFLATIIIQHAEGGLSGAQINIRDKRGRAAMLGLDMLRTPYFFKDRDLYVNENGRRKRIFHIVRTHTRQTARGPQTVKSHFRGQRKFTWNGYRVAITIPGLHHPNLEEFQAVGYDVSGVNDRRQYVGRGKAARMIGQDLMR